MLLGRVKKVEIMPKNTKKLTPGSYEGGGNVEMPMVGVDENLNGRLLVT